jgi:hypothetical protein
MSDTIVDPADAQRRANSPIFGETTERGDAARSLAAALDEADAAEFRLRHEGRPVGMYGEGFDERWRSVNAAVTRHHERVVQRAWQRAIDVGLTEEQLRSAGLRPSLRRG